MFPIKSWLFWPMDISKRLCSLGAPGIFVFCYKLFNLAWLPLFIEFKAFTAESLLTSGHHATCTVALCGLSFYATVKGKQTYSMLHLKGWFIDKTSQISGHTWEVVKVDGSIEPSDYCANFPWLFFAGGEKLSEFSLKEMCLVSFLHTK